MKKPKFLNTECHDWLGEAAEDFIAYLFSKAFNVDELEVFGGSRWGADCVLHHIPTDKYRRIEVKSSDSKRKFQMSGRLNKQLKKCDIFCFVAVKKNENFSFDVSIWKVQKGKRVETSKITNPDTEQLRKYLVTN